MDKKLSFCLFLLRVSVFVVMGMWTIDKFIRPEHAARVFQTFYHFPDLSNSVFILIGIVQLVIVVMFILGIMKTFSYGAVTILHAVSTFSSYTQYMRPYEGSNLLFFAAWPMLAACITLFLFRDRDTFLAFNRLWM